jgi:two-component system, sensor histidine kinase PdtaS
MPVNTSDLNYEKPARMDAWLYVDAITHRTLNDYTAILSMLRRASVAMPDAAGAAILDTVAARLRAAATAYDALRPLRGSPVRNFDEDLERICASLISSILADRAIRLTLACERMCLSAQRSWQISLIISEVVMNAAKHAFSSFAEGDIVVNVRVIGAQIQCVVIDNGEADPSSAPGRGRASLTPWWQTWAA